MEHIMLERKVELYHHNPAAFKYKNFNSNEKQSIQDEKLIWLTENNGKVPLWSRLKLTNAAAKTLTGPVFFGKKDNYEIEIPNRILSLFGHNSHHKNCTNQMVNMKNYQLLSCVFALCAAVRNRLRDWSENLLDIITTTATKQYAQLLHDNAIIDKQFNISSLNNVYHFNGIDFEVKLKQAVAGYLYIPDGLNEFNLARALNWFFRFHKFGIIQCCNRSLAVGCSSDINYSYFMYDCQSEGYPMFKDHQANSYILRTNNLQTLLYCLITTLNVSTKMAKFVIFNADIKTRTLRNQIFAKKTLMDKGLDFESINKNTSSKTNLKTDSFKNIGTTSITAKGRKEISNISLASKRNKKTDKNEALKIYDYRRRIVLDPNKLYYIIAVPKMAKTEPTAKANFEQTPVIENAENIKVNLHRLKTYTTKVADDQTRNSEINTETFNLKQTASTVTLTPNMMTDTNSNSTTTSNSSSSSSLEVYIVDKCGADTNYNPKLTSNKKIEIAQRLKELFAKF